jgi:Domain of unknown function (DUF1877)
MGMIGCLVRVSGEQLTSFLEDVSAFEEMLFSDEEGKENLDDKTIDVDKSWEALTFLLATDGSGSKKLLNKTLFSGNLMNEEQDLGYGPAHYLVPEDVNVLNGLLCTISDDDFMKKYDPDQMTEIYPSCWDNSTDSKEYILEMFQLLKEFYSNAAAKDEAVITYLC